LTYSINEHKHRFASWVASRGASTSPKCRFEVKLGKLLLEESGLKQVASSINNLPSPTNFDIQHKVWREKIIELANIHKKDFTHGIAAKLINIYLKAIFVCGDDINDERIKSIHPPIDSVLLKALYIDNIGNKKMVWKEAQSNKWSKFTSSQYEDVILAIRETMNAQQGLWEIEQFWQGYQ